MIQEAAVRLRRRGRKVALTGLVGMASAKIGAQTLHSWAGLGLGKADAKTLIAGMRPRAKARWRHVDSLLVDEASMLDADLFCTLELIARELRGSALPFGGIQLLFVADFCQLKCVEGQWMFLANTVFSICFPADGRIFLTHVFRQSERLFLDLLANARRGFFPAESRALLATRVVSAAELSELDAPVLLPRVAECAQYNETKQAALPAPVHEFRAVETGSAAAVQQLERCAPLALALKLGSLVAVTCNLPALRLYNGSTGVVTQLPGGTSCVSWWVACGGIWCVVSGGQGEDDTVTIRAGCGAHDSRHIKLPRQVFTVVVAPRAASRQAVTSLLAVARRAWTSRASHASWLRARSSR